MRYAHYFGLQESVASLSHLGAAAVFVGASILLYKRVRGDVLRSVSLLIFSASLLFLFSMSGVYHALGLLIVVDVYFSRLPYWAIVAGYIGLGSLDG